MKNILIICAVLFSSFGNSQDLSDGMRFANYQQFGTARFAALGGAMGALGGDFSAINVNPAGSINFSNNQFSATFNTSNISNESNYFGEINKLNNTTFNVNQAGAVWVFESRKETDWKKVTFAMNYENTHNFEFNKLSSGLNPNNSIDNYFLSYANGIPLNIITNNNFENLNYAEQQAYLGYEGYFIRNQVGSTTRYESDLTGRGNFYHRNAVQSFGYSSKINFNLATSYKDIFSFGMNLNAHFTDATRTSTFTEDYRFSQGHLNNTGVQSSRFINELYTYGTGFSAQFGAIAKINKSLRVGLAYESPTWFTLNDELKQTLNVNCVDCGLNLNSFFADPDLLVIYPSYQLQTPSKTTGSIAYIFGKRGLLSLDYALKNYSGTQFDPATDYSNVNSQMASEFSTNTAEIRIGGEYRLKRLSLRGGFRQEQSPFKNNATIGDLTALSGGLGYNFGTFRLDFSLLNYQQKSQHQFFSQGLIDRANIHSNFTTGTLTLVFEL